MVTLVVMVELNYLPSLSCLIDLYLSSLPINHKQPVSSFDQSRIVLGIYVKLKSEIGFFQTDLASL